jgi:predicted MFS family arabinose efflux permease
VSEFGPGFLNSPIVSTPSLRQPLVSDRSPRARRLAVTAVFFLVGSVAGTWAARIPAVKAHLHLSAGVLGLALLGPAVGAVVAMAVVSAVLVKVKPRRLVRAMFVPFGILLYVLSVVGSPWQLFAALVGLGAATGTIDVAMNMEAAALQDHVGRRIMSRFHAAYSLGGLAGAGGGALAAATGMSVTVNFSIVGFLVLTMGVAASSAFSRTPMRPSPSSESGLVRSPRRPKLSWSLAGLCTIAFGCFLADGAVNNWSAVYLHSSLRAGTGLAAVAYTAFSCAMAGGRLFGDHLAERVGPVRLVRLSAAIATVGLAAALAVGQVGAAMAGFVLLGLGMSFVVPLVFTTSSQLERPGPSLAAVSSFGYLGLLVGPALIGGIADAIGLRDALGVIVAVSAVTTVLAGTVAPKRPLGERTSS